MSEIKTELQRVKEKYSDRTISYLADHVFLKFSREEVSELRDHIKQLEQELAEAKKESLEAKQDSLAALNDQARYQFLRNRALGVHKDDMSVINDFESVIDAAIAAKESSK